MTVNQERWVTGQDASPHEAPGAAAATDRAVVGVLLDRGGGRTYAPGVAGAPAGAYHERHERRDHAHPGSHPCR